jgi:hypothetical protein
VQATRAKIGKRDYIKLKSFWTAKNTINTAKRQPMNYTKIFAVHTSDKGIIYCQVWWLTPITLGTQEMEIARIMV